MIEIFRISRLRAVYPIRGLAVWVCLRLALVLGDLTDPVGWQAILVLSIVAVAVVLDARRRGEDEFLGNLGIPVFAIALAAMPLALVGELLV